MLGKDLFKIESKVDLSFSRYKALILFYNPLIGNDAHYLYEFLNIKGSSASFEELNKLLNSLNISIDSFEEAIKQLNKYKLVKTLKNKEEEKYIFVLENPLNVDEFIKDDLFVRDFILKKGGLYYQSLISDCRFFAKHPKYNDISAKFEVEELATWSKDDETFLKPHQQKVTNIDSLFDINAFLNDMSMTLFPLKYRSYENLKEIANLADLYNISKEKMRAYIPQVSKSDSNVFDLNLLRYLCQNAVPEYKYVEDGKYDIPCLLFLMNKQEGKEVSPFDKKIIYNLANNYKLKPGVINVLLEHGLKACDNRLLENFLYPIASDLHRNDINTANQALDRLNYSVNKRTVVEKKETYDSKNNPEYNEKRREELLKYRRGNNE